MEPPEELKQNFLTLNLEVFKKPKCGAGGAGGRSSEARIRLASDATASTAAIWAHERTLATPAALWEWSCSVSSP